MQRLPVRDFPPGLHRKAPLRGPDPCISLNCPPLPNLGWTVVLVEECEVDPCSGCFPEWPWPGTCGLWRCSNRNCNFWGGGNRDSVCRCPRLRDLVTVHGVNAPFNGRDGYISGTTDVTGSGITLLPIRYTVTVFDARLGLTSRCRSTN